MSTMRAFSVEYFDRIDIEIPDAKTEVTITSIPPNIEVRVGKVNAGPLLISHEFSTCMPVVAQQKNGDFIQYHAFSPGRILDPTLTDSP